MVPLLLRRESFGGVLASFEEGPIRLLNPSGFEIAHSIARGASEPEILRHLDERFVLDDVSLVKKDIAKITDLVSNPCHWDSGCSQGACTAVSHLDAFPTLSAPLDLQWEITRRCNLRCLHCYNDSGDGTAEPSLQNIRLVCRELGTRTLRSLTVSGGEPLIRSDIRDVVETVRPVAARLVLATNGTLIDDAMASLIAEFFDLVNLTVHSGEAHSYARFSGGRDAFARCLNGLRLLSQRNVRVVVQTVVSRDSVSSLEALGKLVVEGGAFAWVVRFPFRSGRARENQSAFLSREEIVALLPYLDGIKTRFEDKLERLDIGMPYRWTLEHPYEAVEQGDRLLTCAAATVMAALTADGRLAPCPLFAHTDFTSKPIWATGILEPWKIDPCFGFFRSVRLRSFRKCATCRDIGTLCNGGCRAMSYLAGDISATDPNCGYAATDIRA